MEEKLILTFATNLVPRAIMSFSCRTQLAVESLEEKGIMALGSRLICNGITGKRWKADDPSIKNLWTPNLHRATNIYFFISRSLYRDHKPIRLNSY